LFCGLAVYNALEDDYRSASVSLIDASFSLCVKYYNDMDVVQMLLADNYSESRTNKE
jgi:hypothetical protein